MINIGCCPLDNGPKLFVGQPNSRQNYRKKSIVRHLKINLVEFFYSSASYRVEGQDITERGSIFTGEVFKAFFLRNLLKTSYFCFPFFY